MDWREAEALLLSNQGIVAVLASAVLPDAESAVFLSVDLAARLAQRSRRLHTQACALLGPDVWGRVVGRVLRLPPVARSESTVRLLSAFRASPAAVESFGAKLHVELLGRPQLNRPPSSPTHSAFRGITSGAGAGVGAFAGAGAGVDPGSALVSGGHAAAGAQSPYSSAPSRPRSQGGSKRLPGLPYRGRRPSPIGLPDEPPLQPFVRSSAGIRALEAVARGESPGVGDDSESRSAALASGGAAATAAVVHDDHGGDARDGRTRSGAAVAASVLSQFAEEPWAALAMPHHPRDAAPSAPLSARRSGSSHAASELDAVARPKTEHSWRSSRGGQAPSGPGTGPSAAETSGMQRLRLVLAAAETSRRIPPAQDAPAVRDGVSYRDLIDAVTSGRPTEVLTDFSPTQQPFHGELSPSKPSGAPSKASSPRPLFGRRRFRKVSPVADVGGGGGSFGGAPAAAKTVSWAVGAPAAAEAAALGRSTSVDAPSSPPPRPLLQTVRSGRMPQRNASVKDRLRAQQADAAVKLAAAIGGAPAVAPAVALSSVTMRHPFASASEPFAGAVASAPATNTLPSGTNDNRRAAGLPSAYPTHRRFKPGEARGFGGVSSTRVLPVGALGTSRGTRPGTLIRRRTATNPAVKVVPGSSAGGSRPLSRALG